MEFLKVCKYVVFTDRFMSVTCCCFFVKEILLLQHKCTKWFLFNVNKKNLHFQQTEINYTGFSVLQTLFMQFLEKKILSVKTHISPLFFPAVKISHIKFNSSPSTKKRFVGKVV